MNTIKKSLMLLCSVIMSLALTSASAQTDQEAAFKKLLEPKLGTNIKIDSIKKTPYSGLIELVIGDEIYYTDEKGQYLIVGSIMDLNSHRNLTKMRLENLHTMSFSDLPLDLAFKQVKGDGKRVIAVFEDPNCGYCKRLRKELQHVDNVTIYTFMYDILSDDSAVKSRNVWCSPDPAKTWNDWMINGTPAPEAPASCMTNPHEQIMALGGKLHINGTPAVFFADGSRIPGFVDAAGIEEKLNSIK